MNTHEGFAARCVRAIEELQEVEGVDVDTRGIPAVVPELADPDWVLRDVAERTGIRLAESPFREYFFAPDQLRARWNTTADPDVIGEFCLTHIHRCLVEGPAGLQDPTLTEAENEILAELRIIDQEPMAGSGRVTGLRVAAEREDHEIWLYDMSQERLERLGIDYGTYLENILVTKGAYGWQYLFADADLNDPGLDDIATNLTMMLGIFPDMFPNHSYEDLRERLEARL
ncbi:hypothetical protein [Streptomyces sp. NBC_00258]|uniref:hypothetical protein n=1 Tax=Streptomyces sp. NBC_00258 TaxID=2903642 RepID=UPI002E2D5C2E|nr:hypothetical protein [Streptomyces sp. NBC_00258]